MEFHATSTASNHTTLLTPTLRETVTAFNTEWIILYADTQAITTSEDAQIEFSVDFYATLTYSNGATVTAKANSEPFTRSALQVAQSALNDRETDYSDAIREKLTQLAAYA